MATVASGVVRGSRPGVVAAVRSRMPAGGSLPQEIWERRHGGIVVVLWAHVPAIVLFAVVQGEGLRHGLLEASAVVVLASAATLPQLSRMERTTAAALGLLTSSAVLVHLSGGVIEMHFHFFVMVGVVVLYQEWVPFLASVAYVVLHHAVIGSLDPESVFNHSAALNAPWKWAGIHG